LFPSPGPSPIISYSNSTWRPPFLSSNNHFARSALDSSGHQRLLKNLAGKEEGGELNPDEFEDEDEDANREFRAAPIRDCSGL
jgi:hypothetical protein